jgi:hypothetical protein
LIFFVMAGQEREARLRARQPGHPRFAATSDGVPRMLRSAPRLRRDALLIRGPHSAAVGPGSAEQRFTLHRVRDTGKRGERYFFCP